jgi:phosphoribosylformylglycinamidine synthase
LRDIIKQIVKDSDILTVRCVMVRYLVEKREPFRLDERDMQQEIIKVLGVPGITDVRIFNVYDIEGVKDVGKAKHAVFSEAGADIIYEEKADTADAAYVLFTAAAIDQYDQREDYANLLLRVLEPESKPVVRAFKQIAFYGEISEAEYDKIKAYYINPLETRELSGEATKQRVYPDAENVKSIEGFTKSGDDGLLDIAALYGIAMNLDNLRLCREYFNKENRDPTVTEMKVLDTYWSDHCRHSTFLTVIENVSIGKNELTAGLERAQSLYEAAKKYVYGDISRPLCLMDIATMEMKKLKKSGVLDDLEKSDEVNACSIEVKVPVDGKPTDMIVMFKNETHNHPTEMEPFGGASTCLGGAIRDTLSGRAYSFGAIRLTGSGDPREKVTDTIPGKLPQRKITRTAAEGYSSYGNGIGLALGHLMEVYDPGFKAKRLECGAIVAVAEKEDIIREKAEPGDVVVLIGGATGRDGCGGATGSSKEQNDSSLEKGGAEVQKGNPTLERSIVRLFRKPSVSRIIKACNDFGAGGVCVAVGELADGLDIDLDKVPVKYPGLDGTELAISESQERMAVVIKAEDLDKLITEAVKENLNAAKIAEVTDSGHVFMNWRGKRILDISSDFLNSGGVRQRENVIVLPPEKLFSDEKQEDIKKAWLNNLSDLNVCSKIGIAGLFDTTAGGVTVFMPYGGKHQKTPEHGLAKRLPLREGKTDYGTLMTVGYNPALGYKSPFHAAMYAVIESIMKIVAMGADYQKIRLSFQEYFEKQASDESRGKPYAALMGAFLALDELGIPAIGGKDSMSGTFNEINVPPSLISFAVAVTDTTKLVSRAFKAAGSKVYLMKTPVDESGVPDFKILKQNMSEIYELVQKGQVKAASIVGIGGLAAAVSEMVFGNGIGFSFDSGYTGKLFTPDYTAMILELSDEAVCDFTLLGVTLEKQDIQVNGVTIPLNQALEAWENTLGEVFPIRDTENNITGQSTTNQVSAKSSAKTSDPSNSVPVATVEHGAKHARVLIPIFPGTTGEYEMEDRFKKAGAEVTTLVFRTLTKNDIISSYAELAEAVSKTDILAIPSGMSAAAEPDGSGKLITMILRHPDVKEAVNKLVKSEKGLILGLGEGFKALLKTGLIQTGLIQDDESGDVLLTKFPFNEYHSTLKNVKMEQVSSPWLNNKSGAIETVPISAREGVVFMSRELLSKYRDKGQIASCFTDNQLPCSVEAMISENGRILGRLGLVERLDEGLYSNVFEATESSIFANAVRFYG